LRNGGGIASNIGGSSVGGVILLTKVGATKNAMAANRRSTIKLK